MEGHAHEIKGAVRGYEGDGAVVLKARQPHALVELHVLQVDRLAALGASPLCLEEHLWGCNRISGYRVRAT